MRHQTPILGAVGIVPFGNKKGEGISPPLLLIRRTKAQPAYTPTFSRLDSLISSTSFARIRIPKNDR
jgi:hypothetical protein